MFTVQILKILMKLYLYRLQGDLDEEIPESCSSSDDDLELDETNLGEGLFSSANTHASEIIWY